jgi:hypothetical protein
VFDPELLGKYSKINVQKYLELSNFCSIVGKNGEKDRFIISLSLFCNTGTNDELIVLNVEIPERRILEFCPLDGAAVCSRPWMRTRSRRLKHAFHK